MSTDNVSAAAAAAEVMPTEELELNQIHAVGKEFNKVDVKTGAEDEDCVYTERALLYRFAEADNTWKERARGDVQLLKSKIDGKIRVVMYAEKIEKVRLNHRVGDVELKPNAGSDKAWTWRWLDYAVDEGTEPETHTFAIRFRTPENANEFKAQWDIARATNYPKEGAEKPKAEEPKEAAEEPKAEEPKEAAEEPKAEETEKTEA